MSEHEYDDWTADDLRAAVERGDVIPYLAEYHIAAMESDGVTTLGELWGRSTGIIAEWAAAQPGGVEVGGRPVKPDTDRRRHRRRTGPVIGRRSA